MSNVFLLYRSVIVSLVESDVEPVDGFRRTTAAYNTESKTNEEKEEMDAGVPSLYMPP